MPNAAVRMTVNGIDLEVLRRGSGPPLFILHGLDSIDPRSPYLDLLGRDFEIIAPSPPVFGTPPRRDDFDPVYALIHFLLAAIGALPYAKVALLGFSLGGWRGAEIAASCGDRLSKLIL